MITSTEIKPLYSYNNIPINFRIDKTDLNEKDIIDKYIGNWEDELSKQRRLISELCGKYAGPISLTKALLEERAADRAREERKFRSLYKRP